MRFHRLIRALEQKIGAGASGMRPASFQLTLNWAGRALIRRLGEFCQKLIVGFRRLGRRASRPGGLRLLWGGLAVRRPLGGSLIARTLRVKQLQVGDLILSGACVGFRAVASVASGAMRNRLRTNGRITHASQKPLPKR